LSPWPSASRGCGGKGASSWDEHRELVALQRPTGAGQVALTTLALLLHITVQAIAMAFGEHVGG
jgi:hypothetical protein